MSLFFDGVLAECMVLEVQQGIAVFWSVEEHSAKDVARFLSLIPDLDWSQPVVILTLPTILLPAVSYVPLVFIYLEKVLCLNRHRNDSLHSL